ncbi:hypothetical protein EVAR_74703_1 [Eumeta japonica]|uniref:Uncharacterized protein n=1 Tax=Eumeta variegata TaxID=151549 RepID=A0A4C1YIK9_EUMVA|nr:hypothetical protein EVAR_74703_1 [Eumeta japonica]
MTELPIGHYRTNVGRGTTEGRRRRRRRRRRRKVRFPLLPRRIRGPPEGTVLTSRLGSCDGDASSVAQVKAHSRDQTRDGPAAADSATEGGTTTREASDNPDLQTNASTANKPDFSTTDTNGPEYMAAGAADGDPPDYHGGSGPNPNSAASTAPYPRSTPSSLRVMYWNAGGISGKTQDLRTLVQSQVAKISPPSRTCTLKNEGVEDPRTNRQIAAPVTVRIRCRKIGWLSR